MQPIRLAAAFMFSVMASLAFGQASSFPNRPIRIIVPFTPGSGSDTSSRFFGEQMSAILGQPMIIENKPGAGGTIGLQAAKTAPADGYTIVLASNSPMSVNPIVTKNLPYDPIKDFKPIGGLTRGMNVLVVPLESKFGSLADLIAAAKTDGRVTVATYSAGYQLASAWLASSAGVKFTNVAYKGQAPIMNDIIGNQLDAALVDMGGAVPLLKTGKVRALAVSGERRHPEFPDVPTIRESGYPDYVQYSWVSFYVRSQTPDDVIAKLADALQKVLASNEAREFVKKTGGDLMPYPPAAMQKFHLEEIERFRRIAEAAGIQPE